MSEPLGRIQNLLFIVTIQKKEKSIEFSGGVMDKMER